MAEQTFVEVTGVGTASSTPDRLRAHLATSAEAPTVVEAFTQAGEALRAMLAVLREHGVADEDLRSTGIDIHSDRDDYRPSGQHPSGHYQAHMSVEALLRDVDSAGATLSAAVEAGGDASRVHGISLAASTTDEALARAREGAWADASGKAQQYAYLADRSLGRVLSVSEPDGRGGAIPLAAEAVPASATPVERGTRALHAAITVRWELT